MLTQDDFDSLPVQPEPSPAPRRQRTNISVTVPGDAPPRQAAPRTAGAVPAQVIDQFVSAAQKYNVDPSMLYSVAKDTGAKDVDTLAARMGEAFAAEGSATKALALLYAGDGADFQTKVEATKRALKVSMGAEVGAFRSSFNNFNAKQDKYQVAAKEYFDALLQAKTEDEAARVARTAAPTVMKKHGLGADDVYLLDKQVRKLYAEDRKTKQGQYNTAASASAAANLPREVSSLADRYPPTGKVSTEGRTDSEVRKDSLLSFAGQGLAAVAKMGAGLADVALTPLRDSAVRRKNMSDFARSVTDPQAARDAEAADPANAQRVAKGTIGGPKYLNDPSVAQRVTTGAIGGDRATSDFYAAQDQQRARALRELELANAKPVPSAGETALGVLSGDTTISQAANNLGLPAVEKALNDHKSAYIRGLHAGLDNVRGPANTAKYLKDHPELVVDMGLQNLLPMLLGGKLASAGAKLEGLTGREILSTLGKRSAVTEGVQQTGSAFNEAAAADGKITPQEAVGAVGSGVVDTLVSRGVGAVLPEGDTDALIARMFTKSRPTLTPAQYAKNLVTTPAKSALGSTGEELLQSGSETAFDNYAKGKPITEDVGKQAVVGAAAGAGMGAAGGTLSAARNKVARAPKVAPVDVMGEIEDIFAGKTPTTPLALPEPADAKFARQNPEIVANAKAKEAAAKDVQSLNKNQTLALPEPKEIADAKAMPDLSKVSDDQLKYLATQHPDPAVRAEVLNTWEARKLSPENFTLGDKLETGTTEAPATEAEGLTPATDHSRQLNLLGDAQQKDMFEGWQQVAPNTTEAPNTTPSIAQERNAQQGELDLGTRRKAEWQKETQPEQVPTQQVETALPDDIAENRRLAAERDSVLAMPVKDAIASLGLSKSAQVSALRQAQKAGATTGRDLVSAFQSDTHALSQNSLQNSSGKWAAELGTALENKLTEWSYANQQAPQVDTPRAARETITAPAAPTLSAGQHVRKVPGKPGVFQVVQTKAKPAPIAEGTKPAETVPQTKPTKTGNMWDGLVPKASVDETSQLEHQTTAAEIEQALRGHPQLGGVLGKLLDSGHINISESLASNPKAAGSDEGGKINLYTSRLPSGRAVAVTVHEAVHTALERHLGKNGFARLIKQLTTMEQAARNGTGEVSQFFKDAAKRIPANTPDEHRGEELGAYAVQKVMEGKAPKGVVAWVKNLVAQVRAALFKATNGRIGKVDEKVLHQLTMQALKGWADKAQAGTQEGATKLAQTDPTREAQQWNDVWQNDAGPEYYGNGFALIATHDYGVVEHDFIDTPDGVPAWVMGHAASVNPDNRAVAFHIFDRNGAPAGSMIAEVAPQGNIEAIHDMNIMPESRNGGLGSTIVKQTAANASGAVRILEAKNENAQRFWTRNGAGYYDAYKNSALDWESHQAASDSGANLPQRQDDTGAAGTDAETGATKYAELKPEDFDPSGGDLAEPRKLGKLLELFKVGKHVFQAESFRAFVEYNAKHLPSLEAWHKTLVSQETAANENIQRSSEVMSQLNDLGKAKADALLRLMQEESFNGVYASRELMPDATEEQRIAHMRLAVQYNKLSQQEKDAYAAVRKTLADQWEEIHKSLRAITVSTIHDPNKQHEALRQIDALYTKTKNAPYFPLQRHGKYIVVGYNYDGAGSSLLASYDTKDEADRASAELKRRGLKDVSIFLRPSAETFDRTTVPPSGFLTDLHDAIDGHISDDGDKQALHTALQNLYLQALPEFSGAKKMLGRSAKPVIGFDADARRSLAISLFSGARYAAQLQYAPRTNALMRDMTDEAQGKNHAYVFITLGEEPEVKVFDSAADVQEEAAKFANSPDKFTVISNTTPEAVAERLNSVLKTAKHQASKSRIEARKQSAAKLVTALEGDKLNKLVEQAMSQVETVLDAPRRVPGDYTTARQVLDEAKLRNAPPTPNNISKQLVRGGLTAAYTYYLAFNISTAANNLLQTPMISMPYTYGELGMKIASKQFGYWSVKAGKKVVPRLAHEVLTAGYASPLAIDKIHDMSVAQRKMLKEAQSANLLDFTVSADLMNIVNSTSDAADRTMRVLGLFNHWSEVANRLTTALASYEGYKEAHPGATHEQASAYAQEVLHRTHGDYSRLNSAPIMNMDRHPYLALATQFGKFPHAMIEMYLHLLGQLFKADTAGKIAAAKSLAGMFGIGALVGGALAAPLMSTVAYALQAAANAMKGEDDDTFDIRAWWVDQFKGAPEWVADLMIGGLVRTAGLDATGRIGTGDILPVAKLKNTMPAPTNNAAHAATQWLAENLGGATFATLDAVTKGVTTLAQDSDNPMLEPTQKLRGLKDLLPRFAGNPVKAALMAVDGVTDKKGAVVIPKEQFNWWQIATQGAGYTPKEVADYYTNLRKMANDAEKVNQRLAALARRDVELDNALQEAKKSGDIAAVQRIKDATKELDKEVDNFYDANPYAQPLGARIKALATSKETDQAWRDDSEGMAGSKSQYNQWLNSQEHRKRNR